MDRSVFSAIVTGAMLLPAAPASAGQSAAASAVGTAATAAPSRRAIPAAPPAPPPTLPAGIAVSVPCAPPIGTELRYLRSQVEEGSKGKKTNSFEIRVRFERAGDGYRMWTKTELPGVPAAFLAQAPIKVLIRPVEFNVSADGRITGIVDEAGYWRSVDSIIGSYAAAAEPKAGDRQLFLDIYKSMRRLPDEERIALVSRNVAPLLAFCGVEGEVGASWTGGRDEVGLPFPDLPKVVREQRVTLQSATPETAYLRVMSSFDPDSFKRAMEAMLASFPAKEGRPAPPQVFPDIVQTIEVSVSRATGLATAYTEDNRAGPGGGEAEKTSKRVSLQLIR